MFHNGLGFVYLRLMAHGLLLTVEISGGAVALGCLIGVVLGLLRQSSHVWVRIPVIAYVELFRSIPLVILLFLVYYGVPIFLGASIPVIVAAIVGQGLVAGAYITEVVHSGLRAIPRGQYEAARALNLSYGQMMCTVITPQALRVMIPALVGLVVGNIKDSSIASIIGVTELTQTALNVRSQTYTTWDVFAFLILFYLVVNFVVTTVGGKLEKIVGPSTVGDRRRPLVMWRKSVG